MNILTRTVIALTAEEQQTLKNAASILFDLASAIEDRGGNDTGYNIRGMASDLENFVEDNYEIICEEGEAYWSGTSWAASPSAMQSPLSSSAYMTVCASTG